MKVFKLPDLGEGLQEAEIVEWHVRSGDEILADQPLLSVETAKAIVEIPSPQSGRIAKLFGQPGDVVHLGAPLAAFEGEADEADAGTVVGHMQVGQHVVPETPAVPGSGMGAGAGVIKAIPAARALARKLDVDLAMVTPSGPEGVITAADVQRVAKVLAELGPPEVLRGVRRAMAQNMARAQSEVAAATVIDDADIPCVAARYRCHDPPDPRAGGRMPGRTGAQRLVRRTYGRRHVLEKIDLGIAVDLPDGLFVPVLRNVALRDPADLRGGLDRMRADIRARKIPPDELRGNTITLSNFGMIAGKYASPIVVPPTVAILGAGRIHEQVVAEAGVPAVHRILPLSLTFDHRVVTGGEAARFLAATMADLQMAR
jgi:Pyruvate/2-oxoglutarate dehydrogenase complex, dihydrolipoamide acyltransferase (E2) component, and related enzymes